MEKYLYISIFVLLLIIVLFQIIIVLKNNKNKNINKNEINNLNQIYEIKDIIKKELDYYNKSINNDILNYIDKTNTKIEDKFDKINNTVSINLNTNLTKSNDTLKDIIERISKIDEAQKQIDKLSSNIISLQDILTDKKSRGIYGEIQLKHILSSVFGSNNKLYELQKKLDNGLIVDAILYTPKPIGYISIDSKFPLENYQKMNTNNISEIEKQEFRKKFINDVKKHIDDIKNKYIIPNKTANEAIMFIPAEAIFAEINANFQELILYSQKNKVWITSPTTLISTLTTIQLLIRNIEQEKNAKNILIELKKLAVEFKRYEERWQKFEKLFDLIDKERIDIKTTTEKIIKKFNEIQNVDIENKE